MTAFTVLEDVKTVNIGNSIAATVSIGIGTELTADMHRIMRRPVWRWRWRWRGAATRPL